jgi:hypothetical protein
MRGKTGVRVWMRVLALALLVLVFVRADPVSAQRSVLLVLDASGSMNQSIQGRGTRFEAAKAAMREVMGKLSAKTRVALRAYGHQFSPAAKNCNDTALVADFMGVEQARDQLPRQVNELQARGYTPITLALQRAAEDIAQEPALEHVVVLISDGRETCSGDPCAAARALVSGDAKLIVHVVGLGVDAATRTQLQCIAAVARGVYFDAATSSDLSDRLSRAVLAGEFKPPASQPGPARLGVLKIKGILEAGVSVYDATNEIVGAVGAVQPSLELRPGFYSVKFVNGFWTGIEILAGETTEIEPAYLKIETPAKDNLYLSDPETNEDLGEFFMEGSPVAAVLPGLYSAHTSLPFVWTGIELLPGRTTLLRPALARITHRTGETESILYRIVQLASGVEGTAVNGSDLSLPAGKYRVIDTDRPERIAEFAIDEGERLEVLIDR